MPFERYTSFLGALLGRPDLKAEKSEPVEYKGFIIRVEPLKSEGQYQTAGVIERDIDGVRKEHRFIRAEAFPSYADAASFSLSKARQLIDLQGERIFR